MIHVGATANVVIPKDRIFITDFTVQRDVELGEPSRTDVHHMAKAADGHDRPEAHQRTITSQPGQLRQAEDD